MWRRKRRTNRKQRREKRKSQGWRYTCAKNWGQVLSTLIPLLETPRGWMAGLLLSRTWTWYPHLCTWELRWGGGSGPAQQFWQEGGLLRPLLGWIGGDEHHLICKVCKMISPRFYVPLRPTLRTQLWLFRGFFTLEVDGCVMSHSCGIVVQTAPTRVYLGLLTWHSLHKR